MNNRMALALGIGGTENAAMVTDLALRCLAISPCYITRQRKRAENDVITDKRRVFLHSKSFATLSSLEPLPGSFTHSEELR